MKHILSLGLFMLFTASLFSQQYDLAGMQGLRNEKGEVMLELSGYDIFVTTVKGQVNNEKTISSIKKKYNMEAVLSEYSDPNISKANNIIEAESVGRNGSKVKMNQVCYLLGKSDTEVGVILFQTLNPRDTVLEQEVVKVYLDNGLAYYISDEQTANSISFAGRKIDLGSACNRISPHNVNCNGGQMSWSEFPTFESANRDINTHIDSNVKDNLSILAEDDIDVIFEDIPSLAHRVVYRQESEFGERTYPLVVYYIAQEVRGRYVSCVLSNYAYNRNDYELAPLLQEVISIPVLPESASNPFDIPRYEDREKGSFINLIEVRAGNWFPIGNLRNAYEIAPSIGAYFGYPVKKTMAVDIGFQIAFPINRQLFDYSRSNWTEAAKANIVANVNARFRYQQEVAKNVYWTTYAGAGFISVQTNLDKEYYYDDEDKWYSFETLDVFGGVNLRYKKVGLYLEYHYTPYSISGRVSEDFGNSAVNLGVAVCF
ncbi:MAG: hypothetical protein LBN74_08650 [Prevotella sp.]|nr:hypothetical protein [Prevotella sp.]